MIGWSIRNIYLSLYDERCNDFIGLIRGSEDEEKDQYSDEFHIRDSDSDPPSVSKDKSSKHGRFRKDETTDKSRSKWDYQHYQRSIDKNYEEEEDINLDYS